MASSASETQVRISINDGDSDYGSDFSPEEEQILAQLLSGKQVDIEDNPIVNDIEHNDAQQTLRVPRISGRAQKSPLFQAARAAEEVAEHISKTSKSKGGHPICESFLAL